MKEYHCDTCKRVFVLNPPKEHGDFYIDSKNQRHEEKCSGTFILVCPWEKN